eukprot:TRINITY_DN5921_c0_g1_i3.p1 TRINITY_DN5921_c0_g1~~TRINITY_DN5921_c0_g1_i3.p1  ORF type:complete len:1539 (-),score=551.85 TRINITY_DN5921_c0_g1_i3:66-4682(-)
MSDPASPRTDGKKKNTRTTNAANLSGQGTSPKSGRKAAPNGTRQDLKNRAPVAALPASKPALSHHQQQQFSTISRTRSAPPKLEEQLAAMGPGPAAMPQQAPPSVSGHPGQPQLAHHHQPGFMPYHTYVAPMMFGSPTGQIVFIPMQAAGSAPSNGLINAPLPAHHSAQHAPPPPPAQQQQAALVQQHAVSQGPPHAAYFAGPPPFAPGPQQPHMMQQMHHVAAQPTAQMMAHHHHAAAAHHQSLLHPQQLYAAQQPAAAAQLHQPPSSHMMHHHPPPGAKLGSAAPVQAAPRKAIAIVNPTTKQQVLPANNIGNISSTSAAAAAAGLPATSPVGSPAGSSTSLVPPVPVRPSMLLAHAVAAEPAGAYAFTQSSGGPIMPANVTRPTKAIEIRAPPPPKPKQPPPPVASPAAVQPTPPAALAPAAPPVAVPCATAASEVDGEPKPQPAAASVGATTAAHAVAEVAAGDSLPAAPVDVTAAAAAQPVGQQQASSTGSATPEAATEAAPVASAAHHLPAADDIVPAAAAAADASAQPLSSDQEPAKQQAPLAAQPTGPMPQLVEQQQQAAASEAASAASAVDAAAAAIVVVPESQPSESTPGEAPVPAASTPAPPSPPAVPDAPSLSDSSPRDAVRPRRESAGAELAAPVASRQPPGLHVDLSAASRPAPALTQLRYAAGMWSPDTGAGRRVYPLDFLRSMQHIAELRVRPDSLDAIPEQFPFKFCPSLLPAGASPDSEPSPRPPPFRSNSPAFESGGSWRDSSAGPQRGGPRGGLRSSSGSIGDSSRGGMPMPFGQMPPSGRQQQQMPPSGAFPRGVGLPPGAAAAYMQPPNMFGPMRAGPGRPGPPPGIYGKGAAGGPQFGAYGPGGFMAPPPFEPVPHQLPADQRYQPVLDESRLPKLEAVARKTQGLLNKLTIDKFETISEKIMSVGIDSYDILERVIKLVFDKAVSEPKFCSMYAKLCHKLSHLTPAEQPAPDAAAAAAASMLLTSSSESVGAEQQQQKKTNSFRRLLLNRCQEEFESSTHAAYKQQTDLSDATQLSRLERQEAEDKLLLLKKRMLGNIQFIGELFKIKLLSEKIMHECVRALLGHIEQPDIDDIEALCKLLSGIGQKLDHDKARPYMDQYFSRVDALALKKDSLPSRIIFMLENLQELRNNKWVPRPDAAQQAALAAQQQEFGGGGRGGAQDARGAGDGVRLYQQQQPPPPSRGPAPSADGWEVATGRTGRGQLASSGSYRGPSGGYGRDDHQQQQQRGGGGFERSSSGGSGGSDYHRPSLQPHSAAGSEPTLRPQRPGAWQQPQQQQQQPPSAAARPAPAVASRPPPAGPAMAVGSRPAAAAASGAADLEAKVDQLVAELLSTQDVDDTANNLDELRVPASRQPEMVAQVVLQLIEKKEKHRQLLEQLLVRLGQQRIMLPDALVAGFALVAEQLEDVEIDAPHAPQIVAQAVARLLSAEVLPPAALGAVFEPLSDRPPTDKIQAGRLTVAVFRHLLKGFEDARAQPWSVRQVHDALRDLPNSLLSDQNVAAFDQQELSKQSTS